MNNLYNVKDEFEQAAIAHDDLLDFVIIGRMGWSGYDDEDVMDDYNAECVPNYAQIPRAEVLTWADGAKWLDFSCDWGFGAPQAPAVWAYGIKRVYFLVQYDGSMRICSIPRDPRAGELPSMPGG